MAWASRKQGLKTRRVIPKGRIKFAELGLGLSEKERAPVPIEEIRKQGQGMVLTGRTFGQGARSAGSGSGASRPADRPADRTRRARRGATS
jgi:hypothetical protein